MIISSVIKMTVVIICSNPSKWKWPLVQTNQYQNGHLLGSCLQTTDLSTCFDWQAIFSQSAPSYRHTSLDKPSVNEALGPCLFRKLVKCLVSVQIETWVPTRDRWGGGRGRNDEIITDRQTDRETETKRERDRQTDRQTDRETDRQTETERDRERQTDRQTDRDRARARDRQTDRQTFGLK